MKFRKFPESSREGIGHNQRWPYRDLTAGSRAGVLEVYAGPFAIVRDPHRAKEKEAARAGYDHVVVTADVPSVWRKVSPQGR